MIDGYQSIPSLLHDARLMHLNWEPDLLMLRLYFKCLMRNVDETAVPDPVVELRLDGVERIAAYYSPASIEVRPSEFHNATPLTVLDLGEWQQEPCEAHLSVNSRHDDFRMATSCEQEWLFGQPNESGTAFGIHLAFDGHSFGKNAMATGLYFGCDSLETRMAGVPLSTDEWRQRFDAWWKGWQEHWDREDSERDDVDHETVLEDAFIPAGTDLPSDLSYLPPSEAAFQPESTDAPTELLLPINDFHSALLERDWQKLARAYPHFDKSMADRADELSDLYLSHNFGHWVYVRQVDSWWAEGVRACVVVRGVEHVMPDDEDPAMNHETVITYGLLKSDDGWIISTWSQGWPQYGSAPESSGRPSWREGWDLDE